MSALEGQPSWHGWLAAVIPAEARRFRVADDQLEPILAAAGAELVDSAPDVEIASVEELRGDAPCALVRVGPSLLESNALLLRIAERAWAFVQAQAGARRAVRRLRRLGYPSAVVVRWDIEQVLRRPGARDPGHRLGVAERLPSGAIVVGSHAPAGPTVLDDVAARAAQHAAEPAFDPGWPAVRASGVLVARSERLVLKVAIGPARREIERHADALDALRAADPPAAVAERAPDVLARGQSGLAYWSLERRLPGIEPAALEGALVADCVEFLVALHAIGGDARGTSVVHCAEVVARVCRADDARALVALAERLERELADVRRGLGHGDFWRGNMLAREGRLCGVVDWTAAGEGRLPLLDLLNLLTAEREPRYFGRAVVDYLLPWARAGGDALSRAYCERLGLAVGASRLESLAVAYWLDRVARELETYGDRVQRPAWMRENVELVVRALVRPSA